MSFTKPQVQAIEAIEKLQEELAGDSRTPAEKLCFT